MRPVVNIEGALPPTPPESTAPTANGSPCAPLSRPSSPVYWRVEGSLLELTTIRPIAFFTWNSQTYISRVVRRSLVLLMALLRPFLYVSNRKAATRIVHSVLRGISRDRLDLLGEEEFEYKLKPLLKPEGVRYLKALQATGAEVYSSARVSTTLCGHWPASRRSLDHRQPPRLPRWPSHRPPP